MVGESGANRGFFDGPLSSDIEGDQMECESGVNRSIIDERYSSDIQR